MPVSREGETRHAGETREDCWDLPRISRKCNHCRSGAFCFNFADCFAYNDRRRSHAANVTGP